MTDVTPDLEDIFGPPPPADNGNKPRRGRPPRDRSGDEPRPRRGRPPKDRTGEDEKPSRERTPSARRTPLREMGTGLAKGLAFLATSAGMPGAGRALVLQSEAAGPAFDQAVRGTIVDRLLQPLARVGGNAKDLGALVALPVSTEAYLHDPNPMTQAAFQAALIASLPQIARARKTAAKEQAKLESDLADLAEMFGKDPGEKVSLNEVAMWLMTGSTDGTVMPDPPAPEPTDSD